MPTHERDRSDLGEQDPARKQSVEAVIDTGSDGVWLTGDMHRQRSRRGRSADYQPQAVLRTPDRADVDAPLGAGVATIPLASAKMRSASCRKRS
jgi:hypothetical protein